ncbi:MAG: hypothetical protein AAFY57_05885 [Cyanobacteria bacterium J06642_2]
MAPHPTVYFHNGVGGYEGTEDTWINEAFKQRNYGDRSLLIADDDITKLIAWGAISPGKRC